jgi:hypothetical protein
MPLTVLWSCKWNLHGEDRGIGDALRGAKESARARGFDGLELDAGPLDFPPFIGEADESGPLPFSGVRAIRGTLVARSVGDAVHSLRTWFDLLSGTEVGLLSIALPPLERWPVGAAGWDYRQSLDYAAKVLQGVRRDAERAGIPLALEACAGGCLLSPLELADLLDAASTWAAGAMVNVYRLAAISRPAEWITALGRRLRGLRIPSEDSSLDRDAVTDCLQRLACGAHERACSAVDELFVIAGDASPAGAIAVSRAEPIG